MRIELQNIRRININYSNITLLYSDFDVRLQRILRSP